MIDNEIIKALECCAKSSCKNCPENCGSAMCLKNLVIDSLDLINRQKAEVERLQDKLIISDGIEIKLRDDMYVLKDELQRAKVEISKHYDYMDKAENEAIDVFANSLKIKLNRMIDNLVKEMTGE